MLGGLNGFRISDLGNATARLTWISTQLKNVHESFADGINIDIEDPVKNGSQEMSWLTQFVGEVYQQFKATNKNYQVGMYLLIFFCVRTGNFLFLFSKAPLCVCVLLYK